ncbi:hypothetical protein DRQ09_03970 [candidate division KSB1 bacterium]|nr:MAG: hypothetical protein DRQ09_03970 [candidate division KSB1 bacterium]
MNKLKIFLVGLGLFIYSGGLMLLLYLVFIKTGEATRPAIQDFLIALFMGGIGSLIYINASFSYHVSKKTFDITWGWWYLFGPINGMFFAVIMLFLLKAVMLAVFPSASEATDMNNFAVGAYAGFIGLFAKQGTDKLREIFEELFITKEEKTKTKPAAK